MNKIKKPSFNVLYLFQFPKYVATWRLKAITDGGYFFYTSKGFDTTLVTPSRFDFIARRFLLDEVAFPTQTSPAPNQSTLAPKRVKVVVEEEDAFMKRNYKREQLDALVDNIDDIDF